jgi:hypothetical protein
LLNSGASYRNFGAFRHTSRFLNSISAVLVKVILFVPALFSGFPESPLLPVVFDAPSDGISDELSFDSATVLCFSKAGSSSSSDLSSSMEEVIFARV